MSEEKKYWNSVIWSLIYMILFSILTILTIYYLPKNVQMATSIIGIVLIVVYCFVLPYKREWLFIMGVFELLAVMVLGVWIGEQLDLQGVISIGVAISFVDILSFTKYGKHTANAKAMSNVQFMARLVVYGKGKGDVLYPTRGIGDFTYYAIWIAGMGCVRKDLLAYSMASAAIVLGTIVDCILIAKLRKKETYKGFPATVLPFLCMMGCYALFYYS